HLRRRHPRRCQRRRLHPAPAPASRLLEPQPMSAPAAAVAERRSWTRLLARWETLLVVALLGLIVLGNALSPFFLTSANFGNLLASLMESSMMALPMRRSIIAGEIDLSVESMSGLSSAILGFLWAA